MCINHSPILLNYIYSLDYSGFDVQKQTISIGNTHILNSLGTFIINGICKIVVNQVLSPAIYYRSILHHKGISI
jgi:DNA-directed RNA polymerase subunit beta